MKHIFFTGGHRKGFSLIELIVTIAIMAVLTAVLTPALLSYVERARAQKDEFATGELENAINLSLCDEIIYDELLMCAEDGVTTIAFVNDEQRYIIDDAEIVGGEYHGTKLSQLKAVGEYNTSQTVADSSENPTAYLASELNNIIGESIQLTSRTHRNESFVVSIDFRTEGFEDQEDQNEPEEPVPVASSLRSISGLGVRSSFREPKNIVFRSGNDPYQNVLMTYEYLPETMPKCPARAGYIGHWDKTLEEIADSQDDPVVVTSVYVTDQSVDKYRVTLQYVTADDVYGEWENTGMVEQLPATYLGHHVLLTAGNIENYHFACFATKSGDEVTVISYNNPTNTKFGQDTTVYAVYTEEIITAVPTITQIVTTQPYDGGTVVSFTSQRSVPEEYTFVETGYLYKPGRIEDMVEEELYYGKDGIRKSVSKSTGLLGTVSLNIGQVPYGFYITARAYVIIRYQGGAEQYLYSDPITVTVEQ